MSDQREGGSTNSIRMKFDGVVKLWSSGEIEASGDIELRPNELTLLLGKNGAGKSIILSLICTLLERRQLGIVEEFSGFKEISAPSQIKTDSIGILRQEPFDNFFSNLPSDDLSLSLVNQNLSSTSFTDRLESLLSKMDLDGGVLLRRTLKELSSGQAQMLAFLSSIAPRPDVLILDEPFSRLDASNRASFAKLLKDEIQRPGYDKYAICATHSPQYFLPDLGADFPTRAYRVENHDGKISVSNEFFEIAAAAASSSTRVPRFVPGSPKGVINRIEIFDKNANSIARVVNFNLVTEKPNLLIGDNGAGKTLIGRALAGQIPHRPIFKSGLYFEGVKQITADDDTRFTTMRKNGRSVMIPAEPDKWLSESTVKEELALTGSDVISETVFQEYFESEDSIDKLSYGKKRLLSILTIPKEMDLVILDEPFSGLHNDAAAELGEYVSRINSKGDWRFLVVLTNQPEKDKIFLGGENG